MTEDMCANCRFFDGDNHANLCRRYPPTTDPKRDSILAVWPKVELDDWCGEHKARK